MSLRTLRIALWGLVAVAVLGLAAYFILGRATPTQVAAMPYGAPFVLTSSDGSRFDSAKLKGRPHAIFFGFTHCPDVCPTTLARLAKLRKQLGKGDEAFDIVLISVDPERDTPEELATYVTMFNTPVVALTGTSEEIAAVTKSFGIFAEKVPDNTGGYTVDHSSQVLLFDRAGNFAGTIALEETDPPALQKLRNIADS